MKRFYLWVVHLFDKFTYSGKIRFVGAMVISLCLFCIGAMLFLQYDLIKMYELKKQGVSEFRTLSELLKSSTNLQVQIAKLSQEALQDQEVIVPMTAQTDQLLEESMHAIQKAPHTEHVLKAIETLEINKQMELLFSEWKAINDKIYDSKKLTLSRLRKFNQQILYIIQLNITAFRLDQGIEMIIYAVTNVVVDRMPVAQIELTNLATISSDSKVSHNANEDESSLLRRIDSLNRHLHEMEIMINQAVNENITGSDDFHVGELKGIFTPYRSFVSKYLSDIKLSKKPHASALSNVESVLQQGWQTEELLLKNLENNLTFALHVLNSRNRLTILVTVAGFLIFLALYLTRLMRRPLEMLKSAANSLSAGDLSVRVPVTTNDEVSKIIIAFNEMAESWEKSIYKAKMITNRLVEISTSVFNIASKLESNIRDQENNIESMQTQAKMVGANIQNFKKVLGEVNASAFATSTQAEHGRQSLSEMEDVTRQMGSAARLIVDTLSLIEGQVERIKGILNTTVSIADQSNLLSLNTAIRADQTGSTGGGFAVVAGKIRELAEQIAFATLDIEKTIHDIVEGVSKAIVDVEQFSSQILSQIDDEKHVHEQFSLRINETQKQTRTFDAIYSDMEQLFKDTMHIDGMMSGLAKVSSETERSVRKLYSDAERLSGKTEGLKAMIARFQIKTQLTP